MTLGEQIYAARQAKKMTLRALAKAMGVSAPFLSDVEHDRRKLSGERLEQVAKVLDIDIALLEAANGYTREMAEWLSRHPDLVALLREHRRTGQPLRIGGETCSCRHHAEIRYGDTSCQTCGYQRQSMMDECSNCARTAGR